LAAFINHGYGELESEHLLADYRLMSAVHADTYYGDCIRCVEQLLEITITRQALSLLIVPTLGRDARDNHNIRARYILRAAFAFVRNEPPNFVAELHRCVRSGTMLRSP
jgi:hypothetical protein